MQHDLVPVVEQGQRRCPAETLGGTSDEDPRHVWLPLPHEHTMTANGRQVRSSRVVRCALIAERCPVDMIRTLPGEWHRHGAASDHVMTHVVSRKYRGQARTAGSQCA
jgi:hypothetical protein